MANFGLGPDTTEWQHFSMNNFPEPATSVIKDGPLTTPNLLNLQSIKAGPADDAIYLGQHAQSVRLNGGHDQVFGSKSNDTIFVDPIVTFAEISGKISGWFDSTVTKFSLQVTSSNQLLGTFDVLNTSNLTDSKANWSTDQTFKVSLPINTPPKDLEITITSNH